MSFLYDRDRESRDREALANRLQDFIKRWSPPAGNRHERADFEREVYYLFQEAQAVAQAPLIAQMSAAMALVPLVPPMRVVDPKGAK